MKKENRYIAMTITAITVAVVGLISLQIYLLTESYEQKEQAFDRNVLNALNFVSQQVEKEEAASKIFTVALEAPPVHGGGTKKIRKLINHSGPGSSGTMNGNVTWVISDSAPKHRGQEMRVEVFHSTGVDTLTTVIVKGKPAQRQSKEQHSFGYSYSTDGKKFNVSTNADGSTIALLQDTTKKRRREIVTRVVDKMFLIETLPIEQRLDLKKVDSLIKISLFNVGISMDYSFRVIVGNEDSLQRTDDVFSEERIHINGPEQTDSVRSITVNPKNGYRIDSLVVDGVTTGTATRSDKMYVTKSQSPFKVRLFPNDVISPRYELQLFLPEKSSFVFGEMTLLMVLSLVFISIIILSFIYSVRIIFLQKRFAGSVIDFINNMTHEFKTPISTIALASEAIAKPEVLKSRPKIRKYNSLISDENNRMKHQVDTILQMAVLERGEFELKISDVDIHSVIRTAVTNFTLQVEQRNGTVRMDLRASNAIIRGDAVHLANIIHNLLDNAVKYSPVVPTIVIETGNTDHGLIVRVRDNGIGIAKEQISRVFDKYYRGPTGNTHDVKGFGLGLSYVKLITEAHHGTVKIESTAGAGTTVEMMIP